MKELKKELREKIRKSNNLNQDNLIIIKENEREYSLYDYEYNFIDDLEYQIHKSKNENHLYFNDDLYNLYNIRYFLLNNKDNKRINFINKNNYYIIKKKEKSEKRILKKKEDKRIIILNSIDILLNHFKDIEENKMIREKLENEKIKLDNEIRDEKKSKEIKSEFDGLSLEELIMMKELYEKMKK